MISEFFKVSDARKLISPRLPIGVETIYKPFFIILFLSFFILLVSCSPVNNLYNEKINKNENNSKQKTLFKDKKKPKLELDVKEKKIVNFISKFQNLKIENNITIILSKNDNAETIKQFINVIELAVYQKELKNISFKIKIYEDLGELNSFLKSSNLSGKIFVGPLSTSDTSVLNNYCSEGVIFFSFSSNKNLASDCVYLFNFFPDNEMRIIFKHIPDNSKIALLYPENSYGFGINKFIDVVANKSNSIIVNRTSYNENLSNVAEAIKELGKYELRKYELNRQKKILAKKKDNESKKRLLKLEKFKTTKDFDFTHIIIADYGLRLLKVAPLLPYYDIDPNTVKFVGTGAWDDEVFYDEPSLDGSIYPGIELKKRKKLIEDYYELYNEKLLRTSTLPFDLVGLLAFIINNNYTISSLYELLNEENFKFSGIDGSFYFLNNAIERDLSVLRINNGKVDLISK